MRVSPAPQQPPSSQASPHHHHPHHPHHSSQSSSSHMSPAVGGPSCSSSGGGVLGGSGGGGHPSGGGSDARNSPNMHAPPYPPNGSPHPPPPHGYKMGGHMPPSGPPYGQSGGYQQPGGLGYPGARPQGPSMHPYPQNFPPGGPQPPQGPPSSMPPSHQYPPRPPHSNHAPPSQYNPYGHYGGQQWAPNMGQGPPPSGVMGSGAMGAKGQPPGGGGGGLPRPHTPPHYLKHHLHAKMGVYGGPPPPGAGGPPGGTGPQMYPNGPGLPPGMGNSRDSPVGGVGMGGSVGPPGQNNMPPPTSTPGPPDLEGSNSSNPPGGPVPTAIGPDGNPVLDDASQQSTLSNTSAASGDDRSLTPKPMHKEVGGPGGPMPSMMSGGTMMGPGGPMGPGVGGPGGPGQSPLPYGSSPHPLNSSPHPLNSSHPHNSAPSPGATSMSSDQPDFDNMNSPGWPRSPSTQQPPSTVFGNSQQQPPPPSQQPPPPPPPDIYRPTKADNIARLYEMSDSPERRQWLDKLLAFMDENKTPIAACPTISKNPLDLYALYLHVKERGGFMEVTKNKQWKDVAAVMGIGASSSGSYTLRKHYMKHILSYECRFDRGGIDPQPIINQIEASAKKKTTKNVSVPSPGSSNSQDSFPPAASNSSSMDGYSNGPPHPGMPPYPPYPPSSDYPSHMQQRPPTQSQPGGLVYQTTEPVNLSNPFDDECHMMAGRGGTGRASRHPHGYQGYQGNQYPGYQGMHSGYSQGGYPPSSGYPPDSRGYQGPPPPGPPNHQGSYQGYQQPGYQRGAGYPPPPPPPPPNQQGYQQDQYSMSVASNSNSSGCNTSMHSGVGNSTAPSSNTSTVSTTTSCSGTSSTITSSSNSTNCSTAAAPYGNSQLAKQLLTPPRPPHTPSNAPPSAAMLHHHHPHSPLQPPPPPHILHPPHHHHLHHTHHHHHHLQKPGAAASPGPPVQGGASPTSQPYQGPRRHPDFEKQQQQQQQPPPPSPSQQPPPPQPPPGWRGGSAPYPGGYPGPGGQAGGPAPQQPWAGRPSDGSGPPPPPGGPPSTPQWGSLSRYPTPPPPAASTQSFTSQGRWSGGSYTTGPTPRPPAPGTNKNFVVPPPTSFKSSGYGTYMGKQLFPVDSVEAVLPVLPRRKRMTRHNLPPINPWTLLMALRCGLSGEVTWALDTLNILLFDEQTVVYLGLAHMPGLLDTLLEHWRRGLINMFGICEDLEPEEEDHHQQQHASYCQPNKRVKADSGELPWYVSAPRSPSPEPELPHFETADPSDKITMLPSGPDYTLISKTGKPVKIVKREADQFIREAMRRRRIGETLSDEESRQELEDLTTVGSDFIVIGRTESTAHFVCSMRSDVAPLPFTRLLSSGKGPERDREQLEKLRKKAVVKTETASNDLKNKPQLTDKETFVHEDTNKMKIELQNTVSVKMEVVESAAPASAVGTNNKKMEVDDAPASSKSQENKVADVQTVRDSCNGPKNAQSVSNFVTSQKLNRSNKTSKLDAILARMKKEPVEDNAVVTSKVSDSKSLLDMLVGKVETNLSNTSNKEEIPNKEVVVPLTNSNSGTVQAVDTVDGVLGKTEDTIPSKENHETTITRIEKNEKTSLVVVGRKRTCQEVEEEAWSPDEASLCVTSEAEDWLARRVLCTGTILRNLSFIPGNDEIMGKNPAMMALLGRTILLHHEHPSRAPCTPHYDREDDADLSDWCSSLATDSQWWWPYLHHLHEACLVTLCNISGHLDLSQYPEEITRPILSGLLHWATCPASYGQDPLPSGGGGPQSALSPQRLALEALVKLCVQDQNTDLVLATPPFARLERLCSQLTRMLCRGEDQVLREFSINLLHYFSAADTGVARLIALQNGCVSLLVAFIEAAESAAMSVANLQGVNALKENPELMGTSLDMVRRAANTLVHLSKVPENARALATCENRLLTLVMSQILDTYVASQLSQVLFNMAQVKSDFRPMSPLMRSSLISPSVAVNGSVTAAVVPPPSPLNPHGGPQETPVLVAALSDYTSRNSTSSISSSSSTNGTHTSSTAVSTVSSTVTTSNGTSNVRSSNSSADSTPATANTTNCSVTSTSSVVAFGPVTTTTTASSSVATLPASNGTVEKEVVTPMEVDNDNSVGSGRLLETKDGTKTSPVSKEVSSNATNSVSVDSNLNTKINSDSQCLDSRNRGTPPETHCMATTNHTDKSYLTANNIDSNSQENNEDTRLSQSKTDKSTAADKSDKVGNSTDKSEKDTVESISSSSVTSTNSLLPNEIMNDSVPKTNSTLNSKSLEAIGRNLAEKAASKENSNKAVAEDPLTPSGIKCDGAKAGSVLPNEAAVLPSS